MVESNYAHHILMHNHIYDYEFDILHVGNQRSIIEILEKFEILTRQKFVPELLLNAQVHFPEQTFFLSVLNSNQEFFKRSLKIKNSICESAPQN